MDWIDDLSDAELRARLTQRGMSPWAAEVLVEHRDSESASTQIRGWLDG